MDLIQIISVAYIGVMLLLFIVLIVEYFRHKKRVRPYTRYAVALAVGVIVVDASILLLSPGILSAAGGPLFFCMDVVVFARLVVFGAVGMFCAASMGRPYVPLLRAGLSSRRRLGAGMARGVLIWGPTLAAAGVVYSCILFTLVPVRMSDAMRQMLEASATSAPMAMEPSWLGAMVMLEFALAEEITFRLGIQNYIAKLFLLRDDRYWIAILATAAFWSLAHVNTLEPNWVKLAQVFPVGILLGVLYRRYGLEACIVAHGSFNLVLMFLAKHFIQV